MRLTRKICKEPNLPLFFADPELMEDAQASEHTATKPATIATLNGVARSMYFSLEYDIKGQSDFL